MLLTAVSVTAAPVLSAESPQVRVVRAGVAQCAIAAPAAASPQVKAAAQLLATYVKQATGADLRIIDETKAAPGAALIHVGLTAFARQAKLPLQDLDGDGYVIAPVDAHNLVIVGPTDWGTEFGVDEFLERCVGVRWLMPGAHGTYVPSQTDISGPATMIREQPVAFSRLLSGLHGEQQNEWARRLRMHGRISFHHNLLNLFPPQKYRKTHPEFFPLRDGKRFLPADGAHGWQPCFTAPGIVDEAVKNIEAYFKAHPEETSYSLGVNDSGGYCECPNCRAEIPAAKNFLGLDDESDLYFKWCDAVVERVLKDYPDKWFGCLAYSQVAQPPQHVKVNPHIVPFMTYDRMKWADPAIRAEGQQMTEEWLKATPTIGWYNYIYGTPYLLPRVYFHQMAENYRWAAEHGVRAHYAEAYPNWGEGPKLYIALKLQWNPYQDVDALLKEWYVDCVGAAVAPDLAAYYDLWEKFWTGPALKSAWFTRGGQYLNFASPTYLDAVDPSMIQRSRSLLESVVAKAKTADQKARAGILLKAFGYYEASAYAYLGGRAMRTRPLATEADALSALKAAGTAVAMAAKRQQIVAEFASDPVLVQPLPPTRYGALQGASWGAGTLWSVAGWLDKSAAVRAAVAELAHSADPLVAEQADMMLKLHAGNLPAVSTNPGFEDGKDAAAAGWGYWVQDVGKLRRTNEIKRTGAWSLEADDFNRGGPTEIIPVTPGRYLGLCYAYIPKGQDSKGTVELAIVMRGEKNVNLESATTLVQPVPGEWTLIATLLNVTPESRGEKVTKVLFCPIVNGFKPGEKVYLDDCALYRAEE